VKLISILILAVVRVASQQLGTAVLLTALRSDRFGIASRYLFISKKLSQKCKKNQEKLRV